MSKLDWDSLPDAQPVKEKATQASKKFNWDDLPDPKIDETEAAARGAAQGLSMNYADEIAGTGQSVVEDIKSIFTGEKDPNARSPIRDQFGRVTNSKELGGNYEKYRDQSRANFAAAEQAHPGAYTAGEIGAGLLTAAIPIGSTATIAKAALTGAGLGAAGSFGASEANNIKDGVKDIAIGTGIGALAGGSFKAVEKGIPLVKGMLKKADEKVSSNLAKVVVEPDLANPEVFKEATISAKNRVKSFFNPEVDPSYEEFVDIAQKHGIDPKILPESVKFGPDSSASRASRNLAEGRFGEETLKRFNSGLDQVRGAYDKKIVNYAKGAPVDEITAGKILRDSYDEGVTKFFDQMDITHNSILDMAPGMQLSEGSLGKIESSISGIEKFAKGRMARGVTDTQRKQGQQLMNAVDAIRSGNGSYKQTVEALRDIGEAAFQSKNSLADIPVDVQKMRKLYNDINESLLDTVKTNLGDDISNSLVSNNKAMSEFFGDNSLVSRVMGDKTIAPESAFRSLVLSGDSQKINALKKILPPEKWEYLKGAVLENITKRDPEGNFTFKQLHSAMRGKGNTLSSIFTPQELAESAGLVRLGDRFGNPVLSSSGTGASISWQDIYKVPANLSVDAFAVKNANRAAEKQLSKAPAKPSLYNRLNAKTTETLKQLPPRAAAALLGDTPVKNEISEIKSRGPEKWASDGARKLLEHNPQFSQQQIEKLKQTKRGRDLLIKASNSFYRPGTKSMDSLMAELQEEAY